MCHTYTIYSSSCHSPFVPLFCLFSPFPHFCLCPFATAFFFCRHCCNASLRVSVNKWHIVISSVRPCILQLCLGTHLVNLFVWHVVCFQFHIFRLFSHFCQLFVLNIFSVLAFSCFLPFSSFLCASCWAFEIFVFILCSVVLLFISLSNVFYWFKNMK